MSRTTAALLSVVALVACGRGPAPQASHATAQIQGASSGTFDTDQISTLLEIGLTTLPLLFEKPSLVAPAEATPGANGWEPGASAVTTGNMISFVIDGDNYKPTLLAQINAAQSSIWINVFEWQSEGTATEVANALIDAAQRGVAVHIVVDNRGSSSDFKLSPVPSQALMQQMMAAGCEVLAVRYSGYRVNHRKLMVFDGTTAMVMGGNIGGNYLLPLSAGWSYHDAGVLLQGPVVADVAAVFLDSYGRAGGSGLDAPPTPDPVAGNHDDAEVQIIAHAGGEDRNIEREIVQRIDAASDRVVLANGFGMSSDIRAAVVAAAWRGVSVTWLWGAASHDSSLMAQAHFAELRGAGVDIRRYDHPLHMKAYLADDTVIIGSANLDGFSCWLNDEASVQIHSADAAADFYDNVMFPDIAASPPLTGDAVAKSGWRDTVVESVLERIID